MWQSRRLVSDQFQSTVAEPESHWFPSIKQGQWTLPSRTEALKMAHTGPESSEQKSRMNQLSNPSGLEEELCIQLLKWA